MTEDRLLAEFYERCLAAKVTDMSLPQQRLRAKIIAREMGLRYGTMERFFRRASQAGERLRAQSRAEEERAAALAVPGREMLRLSDAETDRAETHWLRVFWRPNGTVYSLWDGNGRMEGAPVLARDGTGAPAVSAGTFGFPLRRAVLPGDVSAAFRRDPRWMLRGVYGEILLSRGEQDRVLDLLRDVLRGQTPPGDEELLAEARTLAESWSIPDVAEAVGIYELLRDGPETGEALAAARKRLARLRREEKMMDVIRWEKSRKRLAIILAVVLAAAALGAGGTILTKHVILPRRQYAAAEERLFRDDRFGAAAGFSAAGNWGDARQRSRELWQSIAPGMTAAAAADTAVGILADGTVVWSGTAIRPEEEWTELDALAGGNGHLLALRSDGTAAAAGDDRYGQCGVEDWRDLAAVAAGARHSVGLRRDGTAVAAGDNSAGQCEVEGWRELTAVAAGDGHTIGLRADGTLIAAGDGSFGQTAVTSWTEITAVAAGRRHTVGLRADGTVVAAGDNSLGQCDVGGWTDIRAVAAAGDLTVGLRADGTVVTAGRLRSGTKEWTDVIAVFAGDEQAWGLRGDGTLLCSGRGAEAVFTGLRLPGSDAAP